MKIRSRKRKEKLLMLNIFGTIFTTTELTGQQMLIATLVSLFSGFFVALIYNIKNKCSKSFIISLVVLPAIVQVVIMMVNGNVGTGVAVAGAFSLVRFRSAAGKGQEISAIFLVMAIGLATGMGYIGIAILLATVISLIMLVLTVLNFGGDNKEDRVLKIQVPENLDFEGKFEEIFKKYLDKFEIIDVKTANMGSLYKISYNIKMKDDSSVKKLIDELRTKNGNLEIAVSRQVSHDDEL